MKKIVNFVCVYVCTIIGASFITGNEIYTFFARYGIGSYLLVLLCFTLFVVLSLTAFIKCKKASAESLLEFFEKCNTKSGAVIFVVKCFTYSTYFIFCTVMLAGLRELFGITFTLISAIICFFLIRRDISSIIKVNAVLFPLVLLYLILLAFFAKSGNNIVFEKVDLNAVFGILSYVSLNVVLLFGSMLKLTNYMTKKQILASTIISGLIFSGLIVSQILILTKAQITNFSMPLIQIASCNKIVYLFTLFVTFVAMISSYLSSLYAIYTKIKQSKNENFYLLLLVLSMLALSFLGFNVMIKFSYIFLGISSLCIVIFLCFFRLKKHY